jgi:uncharacterized protein YjbJ (UPF0337 family)
MAGEVDKLKGQAKQAVGKVTGNPRLEREGKRDQAVGAVKDKLSKIKRAVKDEIDELGDDLDAKTGEKP